MKKVLIVEDQRMPRENMERILLDSGKYKLCASVNGADVALAVCRREKIDLILTKEVSRFARNTVDTLAYTRLLRRQGVGIVFIGDHIDTRQNDGEFRLTIMASVAQEESRKISERVKWGQQRSRERGVVFG